MLKELIDTFEELKKYVFVIDRGSMGRIIIKFNNNNFYHLVGFHKTNINMFIPDKIKSMDKKYKYIKKNINKFDNILKNQIVEKDLLELRIKTFPKIIDLLNGNNTSLFNLKQKIPGSMYNGDYGLLKIYEYDINCLLGLKCENSYKSDLKCAPQSWMASNRFNRLVEGKRAIYLNTIFKIPIELYNEESDLIIA